MNRVGAALAALALWPAAAAACGPHAAPDAAVPSYRAVTGVTLGSTASTPEQIDAYLRAVDRATPRVRTFLAGHSGQGRPIRYAVVGAPHTIARVGALAAVMRRMRAGAMSARQIATVARTRAPFVWIGGNVHGNEISGGEADMALLDELASARTCTIARVLRHVVVVFFPLQNPDGRAALERTNHRRFDLNRDWFARTQPETQAKIAALVRFPPIVFADQHEEGGSGFFFPPNADPIHHEISTEALHAIDRVISPALQRAFRAQRIGFKNYDTYDLFFMGYGDTVPTTLFGAAGMTYEEGNDPPLAERLVHHLLAARTTVLTAAAHHRALTASWGRQWLEAAAQGRRGELQPNRVIEPNDSVRFPVPQTKVYGYVLRAGADAAALVQRLVSVGVRVRRLVDPVAYRAYGGGAGQAAAGDYYVPLGQAAKHWVEALLGEDPDVPFPYFYDVSSWSNPLLMGLEGGSLGVPLSGRTAALSPGDRPTGTGNAWAGDSEAGVELAFRLLAEGVPVGRNAQGAFAATGHADEVAAAAQALRVPLATGTPGPALRLPRVARLADLDSDSTPSGWADWLLAERFGLKIGVVGATDISTGALGRYDVLVVPDGLSSPSELPATALAALQAWVRAGGTLVAWRSRGLAVAQAASLTSVRAVSPPSGFQVPGVALRIALAPSDPVAAGESEDFAFDTGDPIFAAHGAPVVASYPAGDRFFVSGYATGTDALKGTPAVTDEVVGSGRVVLFAFDPVFRGYVEGTERLVGNALLAPRPAGGAALRRAAPQPVDPSALALAAPPYRDATVQVAAEDEPALLAAARAADVPAGFALDRDLTTVTLRVPNPRGLDPAERPWTRRLPGLLAARGVRVLFAAF